MLSDKQVSREIGLAMVHSYGVMTEFLKLLSPKEALTLQALNTFMYRVGVSWCQVKIHFPSMFFTFSSSEYFSAQDNSIYMLSWSNVCHKIDNDAFDFRDGKTIQVSNSIICIK